MPTADLSHPLDGETPTYPGDPPVAVEPAASIAADGYRVTALRLGSHAGTHVDAPAHTEPDGDRLGATPVSRYRLDAVVVDCRDRGAREPIPPSAVPDHPAVGGDATAAPGRPTDGATPAVVFDVGWADRWGTAAYWNHPYLAPETARRCVDRGLAVGIDAASPDPSPSAEAGDDEPAGLPAHRALLGAGLPIVENLRGLEGLARRVTIRAYPLPVDADGSPVRAVAEW